MLMPGGVAEKVGEGVRLLHLCLVGYSCLFLLVAGAFSGERDLGLRDGFTGERGMRGTGLVLAVALEWVLPIGW